MTDKDCAELQRVAESYGVTVVLGHHGDGGPWFAHAVTDPIIEWQGSTPSEAIESVRKTLRERTIKAYNEAAGTATRAKAALDLDQPNGAVNR